MSPKRKLSRRLSKHQLKRSFGLALFIILPKKSILSSSSIPFHHLPQRNYDIALFGDLKLCSDNIFTISSNLLKRKNIITKIVYLLGA